MKLFVVILLLVLGVAVGLVLARWHRMPRKGRTLYEAGRQAFARAELDPAAATAFGVGTEPASKPLVGPGLLRLLDQRVELCGGALDGIVVNVRPGYCVVAHRRTRQVRQIAPALAEQLALNPITFGTLYPNSDLYVRTGTTCTAKGIELLRAVSFAVEAVAPVEARVTG